jgi:hypothetical protein
VEAHARGSRSGDREAPRDKPVASRREAAVGSGQREPPRHKAVASGWLTPPQLFFSMPRACPVEGHARGYAATAFFLDATGMSREGSRWWLLPPQLFFSMPRACPVEGHAGGYCRRYREAPRDKPVASRREAAVGSGQREPPRHKAVASGWLTPPQLFFSMPRVCPVEAHARGYAATAFFLDATGLFRGGSRW